MTRMERKAEAEAKMMAGISAPARSEPARPGVGVAGASHHPHPLIIPLGSKRATDCSSHEASRGPDRVLISEQRNAMADAARAFHRSPLSVLSEPMRHQIFDSVWTNPWLESRRGKYTSEESLRPAFEPEACCGAPLPCVIVQADSTETIPQGKQGNKEAIG